MVLGAGFAIVASTSCGGEKSATPSAVPHADFIVATADSTYWITSVPQGLRVRGVPMLLARVDGRFREIYVADDDRSFYNAALVARSHSR
jgi:hypothetical protein